MKQFLTIILRNQFNLFYRFGYTYIPIAQIIEFSGNFTEETDRAIIDMFSQLTPFEYDEEYLILVFEKRHISESQIEKFELSDLLKIYPLSHQAKDSIESKIDPRIRLESPIFEQILTKIESKIDKQQVEKAIEAVWSICKIEDAPLKYIQDLGMNNIYEGLNHRKNAIKSRNIKDGNYLEYLIAYDRYEYFPNSILGYFYDAGQILAESKGFPSIEGSGLHKSLEELNQKNPDIKTKDIIEFIETDKKLINYVSQTKVNGIKYYIVAPLFLLLRDDLRKVENLQQTKLILYLSYFKEYGDSFKHALVLIGAFFGFRRFYDEYYNQLNLRFFKVNPKADQNEKNTENENLQRQKEKPIIDVVDNSKDVKVEKNDLDRAIVKSSSDRSEEGDRGPKNTALNNELETNEISTPTDGESINKIKIEELIIEALETKKEIKLTEIGNQYKKEIGHKIDNRVIINIIKTMSNIEHFKTSNANMARRIIEMQGEIFEKKE